MKRLFFFICICFACVLTAQAVDYSDKTKYLSKGDTVTIRQDGGMYLAVDDRGTTIIAHGEQMIMPYGELYGVCISKKVAGIKANTNSNM